MGRPKKAAQAQSPPLAENEHVKELLAIMRENNVPTMQDLLAVLKQVGAMERQLDTAVGELQAMRRELADAQSHPVKTALQNTVKTLEKNVAALRVRLDELKQNVINGCKNAVAAFKEKGISALDNIARFFKVRPILETLRGELDKNIRHDDKAIAKIEAISAEYHAAGRHLKNMGRAMLGKDAIQEAKPPGMLAKALLAPCRAERSCNVRMKKDVEAAIGGLARLEDRARPSIEKTMQAHKAQIAQEQKAKPAPKRTRAANAER